MFISARSPLAEIQSHGHVSVQGVLRNGGSLCDRGRDGNDGDNEERMKKRRKRRRGRRRGNRKRKRRRRRGFGAQQAISPRVPTIMKDSV